MKVPPCYGNSNVNEDLVEKDTLSSLTEGEPGHDDTWAVLGDAGQVIHSCGRELTWCGTLSPWDPDPVTDWGYVVSWSSRSFICKVRVVQLPFRGLPRIGTQWKVADTGSFHWTATATPTIFTPTITIGTF